MIEIRLRFGKGARKLFKVATEARRDALSDMADALRSAEIDRKRAGDILDEAAKANETEFRALDLIVKQIVGGALKAVKSAGLAHTFREIGRRWTSGELHTESPDRVEAKDSAADESRLKALCEIDVGGILLGDVPIEAFTLEHAEAAMRQLPKRAKSRGTRRAYAQVIARVLSLAVYPCKLIKVSPLPKQFMPKIDKPPEFSFLYPAEDAALLACRGVPLARRVLFGFLAREGCRLGEALRLRFRDLDLRGEQGEITLQQTKTGVSRSWALNAGVTAALLAWRDRRRAALVHARPALGRDEGELAKALGGALVFVDDHGAAFESWRLAEALRGDLRTAIAPDLRRAELFETTANRQQLRVHDLRGTFVTLAFAAGRNESYVQDRTGHTSSVMLNRYRRPARKAVERQLGTLSPLLAAIPELTELPPDSGGGLEGGQETGPTGRDSELKPSESLGGSTGDRTPDQWIKNPLLYRLSYRPGRARRTARGRRT